MAVEPRDQTEESDLAPSELLDFRRDRADVRFREWCFDNYGGMIQLGEYCLHPADALRLIDGAEKSARNDCAAQLYEQDDDDVMSQYPPLIAMPYQRFLEGELEPSKKLSSLRDTWEGLINTLLAISVAEASCEEDISVTVVANGSERRLKARDLTSDRIADRIMVIQGIREALHEESIIDKLLPSGVVGVLRRFNKTRNGFFHRATLSDKQAEELIKELAPDLHDCLIDMAGLKNVQLLRCHNIKAGSPPVAAVEYLIGHNSRRKYKSLHLGDGLGQTVMSAGQAGGFDRVFAKVDGMALDLSPYLYCRDDENGYYTEILFFKRHEDDQCIYEISGRSTIVASPKASHDADFVRCKNALIASANRRDDDV